jgi:hypothetical protein
MPSSEGDIIDVISDNIERGTENVEEESYF